MSTAATHSPNQRCVQSLTPKENETRLANEPDVDLTDVSPDVSMSLWMGARYSTELGRSDLIRCTFSLNQIGASLSIWSKTETFLFIIEKMEAALFAWARRCGVYIAPQVALLPIRGRGNGLVAAHGSIPATTTVLTVPKGVWVTSRRRVGYLTPAHYDAHPPPRGT